MDAITVGRLILAFDCALECNVPPEGTQRFLAEEVKSVISSGAGLFVAEVREELGERIGLFLEATSSVYIRTMLLEGVRDEDQNVSAAFVELVARVGAPLSDEEDMIAAMERVLERNSKTTNLVAINALRNLPRMRTMRNLDQLNGILERGSLVEKTAVLQLLEDEPALISRFTIELNDILYGRNDVLAAGAGSAVIRGGLFERSEYTNLGMFDRALQAVVSNDAPRKSLAGTVRIPWVTVEEWIFSSDRHVRERGFRCLTIIEADAVRVHDLLFRCLRTEDDSVVVTAILDALAAYSGAIQVASLAETDQVCRMTKSRFRNVRRSAARVLGSFPTMEAVCSVLIDQYHRLEGKYDDEMREVIRSMTEHGVRDKACRTVLADEVSRILSLREMRWSKGRTSLFSDLLFAVDQIGIQMSDSQAELLLAVVKDFRAPNSVKRLAMRLYGQTCRINPGSLEGIVGEFRIQNANRRLAAYRAGRRLVQRCRDRYDTVQIMVDGIREARKVLVANWNRELAAVGKHGDGAAVREIRSFLVDIEAILGAYHEFSERITVESLGN